MKHMVVGVPDRNIGAQHLAALTGMKFRNAG
jgi:hypothetical protein